MMKSLLSMLCGLVILFPSALVPAQVTKSSPQLVVAAAADLNAALTEVAEKYETRTGIKVKLSFGASGALTQQIQNGAPFDVFFSADMD